MCTSRDPSHRPVGVENYLARGARRNSVINEQLSDNIVTVLWASISEVLPLVEACLAVASNSVGWSASIGSNIANKTIAASIEAVVPCSQCKSFTPLQWWHFLLHVQCVNGFDNCGGALDGADLLEATTRVVVHSNKAIKAFLESGNETFWTRSQLILFVKNLTIKSRL